MGRTSTSRAALTPDRAFGGGTEQCPGRAGRVEAVRRGIGGAEPLVGGEGIEAGRSEGAAWNNLKDVACPDVRLAGLDQAGVSGIIEVHTGLGGGGGWRGGERGGVGRRFRKRLRLRGPTERMGAGAYHREQRSASDRGR